LTTKPVGCRVAKVNLKNPWLLEELSERIVTMHLEDDTLGLPNDDVLLDLFGGVEVEVLKDRGCVNLLTYRTLTRQGGAP